MSYNYDRQAMDTNASPMKLLDVIEEVQSTLHGPLRSAGAPDDASIAESKKFSKIIRGVKKLEDLTEDLRVDLDAWIIDYDRDRK